MNTSSTETSMPEPRSAAKNFLERGAQQNEATVHQQRSRPALQLDLTCSAGLNSAQRTYQHEADLKGRGSIYFNTIDRSDRILGDIHGRWWHINDDNIVTGKRENVPVKRIYFREMEETPDQADSKLVGKGWARVTNGNDDLKWINPWRLEIIQTIEEQRQMVMFKYSNARAFELGLRCIRLHDLIATGMTEIEVEPIQTKMISALAEMNIDIKPEYNIDNNLSTSLPR